MRYIVRRKVPRGAKKIHLVRPLSFERIKRLVDSGIEEISMSPSTYARLSKKSRKFLKNAGVKVVIKSVRGRYISRGEVLRQIIDLYRAGLTIREIAAETGIPKSTVHYLLKKARAEKILFKGIRIGR